MEALGILGTFGSVGGSSVGKTTWDHIKHSWWRFRGRRSCRIMFDSCDAARLFKLLLVMAEQTCLKGLKHTQMIMVNNFVYYIPARSFNMSYGKYHVYPVKNNGDTGDLVGYEFWSKKASGIGVWSHIEGWFGMRAHRRIHPLPIQ